MARKRKILIIEDNDSLRESLLRALSRKGYEAIATSSAEEGLGVMLGHLFDLILVDFKLPRSGGDTFISQVRQLGCRCEIIMMTGFADPDSLSVIQKIGARAVVLKEADFMEKVLDTIAAILSSPQQVAETGT